MPLTVEAIYEDGCLKLAQPLPLKEHEKVQITIPIEPSPPLNGYGMFGWKGSNELADWFALSHDLDPEE